MTNEEPTPEEREQAREVAKRTLQSPVTDIAVAYLVHQGNSYGSRGDVAVHNWKYIPALQSGAVAPVITQNLLASRQDGALYTGNVSEFNILKSCVGVVDESLGAITVKDVLELTGSDKAVSPAYADKYLADLAQGSDKDKEILEKVSAMYMQYSADAKVAESLFMEAGQTRGKLEDIVCESEEQAA